ncbi:serine/threonine-protein kinase RsbW [Nocardiopsis mwathae]|uniref:Serine/threonine-protein kinase RsbW n=1 Tax=Nocardiopsis mwathae TaxID=1472723 RepID=A0A7W9YL94_9ACTN|nr:ATP-binding protein [Nocardiopsis mwathae]MBB6174059.1 serine/threonine-protein kinase RsbW [Nocardiopsis mwathae]
MDEQFSITLPRHAYTVTVMRDVLRTAFRVHGICGDCAFPILIAATEACANAVDHGAPAPDYEVRLRLRPSLCLLEVSHTGPEFRAGRVPLPELEWESGRGILLMRALMDSVAFHASRSGGVTVWMCKQLHPAEPSRRGARRSAATIPASRRPPERLHS